MAGHGLKLPALAAVLTLCGCVQGPFPPTTGGLTGSWMIENTASHQTAQVSLPTGTVNIQSRGTLVSFFAASPNGIARMSWSGSGSFTWYLNGQNEGQQPSAWPPGATNLNPPQPTGSLLNTNFVVPCGRGYAYPGSTETVTASAMDGMRQTITGKLTLLVNSSFPI
jgi:hypothetical protein